jgi:hypothetical protein
MSEPICGDRMIIRLAGAEAGSAPLTWGQKAILQDMQDNGDQFSMFGTVPVRDGGTVADVAARLSGLVLRHDALRTRLGMGPGDRLYQQVAGSGQIGLDILTIPDNADRVDTARYIDHLLATWPLTPFDFHSDWPLRMAVLTQRGVGRHLVWVLSHLVADGMANMLLLRELTQDEMASRAASEPRHPQILDVARSEQEPQLRQLSSRAMRYWESQLSHIPALTFGEPTHPRSHAGHRYWQVSFRSSAAHLAILAIAKRTGTDVSRATLAIVATAIGRATGVCPLTINVMVSNRFRPGLADVLAPIAQNSVLTIDVSDASVDEVVARTRSASLTAGMRAYYDPDELKEVIGRSDAERGYPARVSCRFNDQRSMVKRAAEDASLGDVTKEQVRQRLTETSLAWHAPLDGLHEQVSIVVLNRPPDVLSLYLKCDLWCLARGQVEALLRGVEEVAVEAAFDPATPTRVHPAERGPVSKAVRHR